MLKSNDLGLMGRDEDGTTYSSLGGGDQHGQLPLQEAQTTCEVQNALSRQRGPTPWFWWADTLPT
jgi:hypothetical protein